MSCADSRLYVKSVKEASGKVNVFILAPYADDILLISNDKNMLKRLKESLSSRCQISAQREVYFILGMSIKRKWTVSQRNYLEDILNRFNMENCKHISIPLEAGGQFENLLDTDTPIET